MSLQKQVTELLEAQVIDEATASRIRAFYAKKDSTSPLSTAMAIFGSSFAGLGIILIIAHNWDIIPKIAKTILSCVALLIGQIACLYSLRKKAGNRAWSEGSAVFLIAGFGAALVLISQIYHIPGDLAEYLLVWILVAAPLIFIIPSSMASLLTLTGITIYIIDRAADNEPTFWYWILLIPVLIHYYRLFKTGAQRNFLVFHHWMLIISICIALPTIADFYEEWILFSYLAMFSIFISAGSLLNVDRPIIAFQLAGILGMAAVLLIMTYQGVWKSFSTDFPGVRLLLVSPEFISSILLFIAATFLAIKSRKTGAETVPGTNLIYLVILPMSLLFVQPVIVVVLANLCCLLLGVLVIRAGYYQDHLGYLNFGLIILAILAIFRFFDTEISFVARGLIFLTVGLGFFILNIKLLKKRKNEEPQ